MFNNLRKFLQGEVSHFYLLSLAVVLATSAINIARADVCFLPDSEGCEMVPYEEYGGVPNPTYPKDCFATKAEAMSARTSEMDSYYKNGDMWCLKSSCSEYLYNSEYKGGNWSCDQCPDANSIRANFYNCTCPLTAKSGYEINYNTCAYAISQCTGSATTSCVASECQTCAGTGQYSGENECKIPTPVTAHCPEGYVSNEPAGGCYSTQDMVCGSGKCYKETKTPECGEGKRLVKANGVCSCECKTGYHPEGSNCVLNQCTSGVAENTCDTANGYTFEPNNSSFINTSGGTVRCGECVKDEEEKGCKLIWSYEPSDEVECQWGRKESFYNDWCSRCECLEFYDDRTAWDIYVGIEVEKETWGGQATGYNTRIEGYLELFYNNPPISAEYGTADYENSHIDISGTLDLIGFNVPKEHPFNEKNRFSYGNYFRSRILFLTLSDYFDYDVEMGKMEIKITRDERPGWAATFIYDGKSRSWLYNEARTTVPIYDSKPNPIPYLEEKEHRKGDGYINFKPFIVKTTNETYVLYLQNYLCGRIIRLHLPNSLIPVN